MRSLLLSLGLLFACAPLPASGDDDAAPAPDAEAIDQPSFDAETWIAEVEAAGTDEQRVALSGRLLDAVDWRRACGEDDPTAPGRGIVQIHHLDADRSLAEVTCLRGAYQSTFALVDARAGRPPRLVRALGVTEDGRVAADTSATFFGLFERAADSPPRFDILTLSAGHGGCGTEARYDLRPNGGAAVVRIRAHTDCNVPLVTEDWPVTFEAGQ